MAGIYIHIPFCKQACYYCDFHFTVNNSALPSLVDALQKEIFMQRNYLNERIESIYLGGGTPSLLPAEYLENLLKSVRYNFVVADDAEITLEANPDDCTPVNLADWKIAGINRLSIGIQSFSDEDLRYMNRSHDSAVAIAAIEKSLSGGFDNITIDLIYGTPTMSDDQWLKNLEIFSTYNLPHISAYTLTVEAKTPLENFIRKGMLSPPDDEKIVQQFEILIKFCNTKGYDQYEISNFGKPGKYSRHNTSYWKGTSYLGIGPSAHSFNGQSRQWNIRSNQAYIKAIHENIIPATIEFLSEKEKLNEYLMTSLRTMWGIDMSWVKQHYPGNVVDFINQESDLWIDLKKLKREGDILSLTSEGKLMADTILADLFIA